MTNREVKCCSTMVAEPDYHAEMQTDARRAASRVAHNECVRAAGVFRYAADELFAGQFSSPVAALEFVLDAIL